MPLVLATTSGRFLSPPPVAVAAVRLSTDEVASVQANLTQPKPKTWDEQLAPQLVRRDEQIRTAEEVRQAALAVEAARQAAAEAARLQAQQAAASYYIVTPSGNCSSWMTAAGITDQASAFRLISRESGCNPNAVNRSSGACGIGQQLPCGKWSHPWNDPVGGMIDMQAYVFGTYGSWANALNHSLSANWY